MRNRWHGKSGEQLEDQWLDCLDHSDAGRRSHFQQLDWQRHGLLFWDEQSSFSHNERPHY